MKISRLVAVLLAQMALVACSSGGLKSPDQASFVLSGNLSGLASGNSVVLSDAVGSNLTLNDNGSFQFTDRVPFGAAYDVTVVTQPIGESCTVSGNATGTAILANVTNLFISCAATEFTVGGTLTGLAAGTSVVLKDNGGAPLTLTGNGNFVFTKPITYGQSYSVTVSTQPAGQTCSPAYNTGSGSGVNQNVTDVQIVCSTKTYTIGGTVSGLNSASSVTLYNNGADTLTVNANGAFTFGTPVAYGGSYQVIVATQPAGQICSIANSSGSGMNVSANVTNVSIVCSNETFTIGGAVMGLASGQSVTLLDNGTDALTVGASGSFSFSTGVAYGGSYTVAVSSQPVGQVCSVANASQSDVTSVVNDVTVTCMSNTYTIAGTVSGLTSSTSVTLLDNGSDPITISSNGLFQFGTPVASGDNYNVSVARNPTGQTCVVSNGSGTVATSNITAVSVSCTASSSPGTSSGAYKVGGTVSGLPTGDTLVLSNTSDGDSVAVSSSGAFTFPTAQTSGASYDTLVETQPSDAFCTVSNGSGTVGSSDVTSIAVSCTLNAGSGTSVYTIGGSLNGLPQGASVVLADSGNSDAVTVIANGTFTFSLSEPSGFAYDVTVQSAPAGETCTVSAASGNVGLTDVTNILVNCAPITATYTIGGTVNWGSVTSGTFTISLGAGNSVNVSAPNSIFIFPTAQAAGSNYVASITAEPSGSTCYIASGEAGYAISSDVTDIDVICSQQVITYPMTVTVSGLPSGDELFLALNGITNSNPFVNGTTQWPTSLTDGAQYTVSVAEILNISTNSSPNGVTCSVGDGQFTVSGSISETVTCATASYAIGGTVQNLPGSSTATAYSVTLYESAGNDYVTVNGCTDCTTSTNSDFAFPQSVANNTSYDVTVVTQPALGTTTCTVTNGTGTIAGANVTNVTVSCPNPTWSVGGTVSGLPSGGSVTIQDIDSGNTVTVTNSSSPKYPAYTVDSALATGTSYNVTVTSNPTGYTCTVADGTGTVPVITSIGGQNLKNSATNVQVSCAPNPEYVSGTVTWDNSQSTVTGSVSVSLLLNGQYATSSTVSSVPAATTSNGNTTDGTVNSSFSFSQPLTYGSAWAVSVQTVTTGWTCQLTNASGSSITADVKNVEVTCTN